MYDFKIEAADKPVMYRDLASALEGLTSGEPDPIANMANAAALIWETLPDLNWAGFYRNVGDELVLGPFQGRPACLHPHPVRQRRVRSRSRDAPGPTCGERAFLPRPHRVRCRLSERTGRPDRSGREADRSP